MERLETLETPRVKNKAKARMTSKLSVYGSACESADGSWRIVGYVAMGV